MIGALAAVTLGLTGAGTLWAQDYTGPIPPKPDVPYLLHASNLLEPEIAEARVKEEKRDEITFEIAGAHSPARTPLPEPIFIIQADRIRPEALELYRFEEKNSTRELKLKDEPGDKDARPMFLTVTQIEGDLYRIEASETLENGEYSLSPTSGNEVFAFQVY